MTSLFPRWPGVRLLAGSTLFNLASGCYTITLGQALFEKSGSVSAFTGIVVIEYIVPVILGAVAGSMADRINPAVVCAIASIIPALSLIAYVVAPVGLLVVAGVAIGLVINLARPFYRAGIFAVGPRSLDPADLPRYNMRWTVSVQAGQIVGGAVAGGFLWAAGPKWAFLAAAVSYALAAYALASARSTMSSTHEDDGGTHDAGWGSVLREAVSSARSVLSLLLLGVDFLTIAAFNVALAPLVHRLYRNESWLGILDVCFAAGAIVVPVLWSRYACVHQGGVRNHLTVAVPGHVGWIRAASSVKLHRRLDLTRSWADRRFERSQSPSRGRWQLAQVAAHRHTRSDQCLVSRVLITSSTRNLPQRCWQRRHSARARASRPGSRDPRSHVARPLRRSLDGSRWLYCQSSQFSCLRCHVECVPVCSGDVTTVPRALSSATVGHSGRGSKDRSRCGCMLPVNRQRWPPW
jgi:hypothetical protein